LNHKPAGHNSHNIWKAGKLVYFIELLVPWNYQGWDWIILLNLQGYTQKIPANVIGHKNNYHYNYCLIDELKCVLPYGAKLYMLN